MVLHGKPCGRVGRCRIFLVGPAGNGGPLFFAHSRYTPRLPRGRWGADEREDSMGTMTLGIIGGTGLGEALGGLGSGQEHRVDTPFGPTSAPIVTAELGGVPV